jgi:hypothetical protein
MTRSPFSRRILDIGFLAAIALAAIAFCFAGVYLLRFADSTQAVVAQALAAGSTPEQAGKALSSVNVELIQNSLGVHAYVARVLLVSCGMFVSLAFGFLGFALFLVGASGQSDLAAEGKDLGKLSLTNLAPGTVAIVAATLLAAICVTRPLPVAISLGGKPPGFEQSAADRQDPLARPDPNLPKGKGSK